MVQPVARLTFDALREALARDAETPPSDAIHVYSTPAPTGSDPLALWRLDEGEFAAYWGTDEEGWGGTGETLVVKGVDPAGGNDPEVRSTLRAWKAFRQRDEAGRFGEAGRSGAAGRMFVAMPFEAAGDDPDDAWGELASGLMVLPRWSLHTHGGGSCLYLALAGSPTPGLVEELGDELARLELALAEAPRSDVRSDRDRHPSGRRSVATAPSPAPSSGPSSWWNEAIRTALEEIRRGEIEKVVLARHRGCEIGPSIDAPAVLRSLRRDGSGRFRFGMRYEGRAFVGASPERLFENRDGTVEIEALAGTYDMGSRTGGSGLVRAAEHLFASGKDLGEHALVVRGIVEALEPLADSIEAGPWPDVRAARGLAHLSTGVRASLRPGVEALDLIRALHPTPAVGGLPRDRAMRLIARLEPARRGLYAGPVGWMAPDGDASLAVGIRSALLADGRASVFAGAGIVAASDPNAEWTETEAKLRWFEELLDGHIA